MKEIVESGGFDVEMAWLRRFSADAENNLRSFAFRLREALPGHVTIHEKKGFFFKSSKIEGVQIKLEENIYTITVRDNRLSTTVAMVVRGIAISTKTIPPSEWFTRLMNETRKISGDAESLSRSLSEFTTR